MATEKQTLYYGAGVVKAKGAFTAEILMPARIGLEDVWHSQYAGSQVMGKRPGMYIKYLPSKYHQISGEMLTGGAYLFDTLENAKDYENWTTNEFEVGEPKTTYWNQPLFKSVDAFTWKVIGAHNFTPVDGHAIGRLQRFSYHHVGVESILTQLYPVLKDAAESREAVSFWLLHHPEDQMIGVHMSFPKPEKDDDESLLEAVEEVAALDSVAGIFPDALEIEVLLDRTSIYHAVWLPMAEDVKGVKVVSPNFPDLAALTNGDA
ncbi:hypothetical protein FSARC_5022 [Fusarium sarcochroum]|uniref:Uncharacterized protein n=1 Tax=Fusarium sarcochroum TaxID=1208366 RepID=A0A8H4U0S5_9HYPO|nr:hypothetical protein FSARC_5022 [Fusarium sarcochroum]